MSGCRSDKNTLKESILLKIDLALKYTIFNGVVVLGLCLLPSSTLDLDLGLVSGASCLFWIGIEFRLRLVVASSSVNCSRGVPTASIPSFLPLRRLIVH